LEAAIGNLQTYLEGLVVAWLCGWAGKGGIGFSCACCPVWFRRIKIGKVLVSGHAKYSRV